MAKISRQIGTTSQLVDVLAQNSSSVTGAGLTGLAFGTSGLTCYYHRNTANASVAVTLATQTLGTWAAGGFIVVDGTNMPGLYQFGIPNAALASGADTVTFYFQGAANLAPIVLEIELTAVNNQSTGFGLVDASANVVQIAGSAVSTSTAQLGVNVVDLAGTASAGTAGYVGVDWGQVINKTTTNALTGTTISTSQTIATVTNQLTAAAIATGVWQDATAGDFTTASSIGKSLLNAFTVAGGSVFTTASLANVSLPAGGLDNIVIESGINLPQAISLIGAVCAGKSSGVDVGSPVFDGMGNSTTRVSATASSGNRSAVTLTPPSI